MIADATDVAIEWARRNVDSNPHISELIEIRKVESNASTPCVEGLHDEESVHSDEINLCTSVDTEVEPLPSLPHDLHICENRNYHGPPILLGVVRDDEKFDFCMCNPPFFESLEEAGLNPKTSCGGTSEEMVCPGGEKAFITRIIEDSAELKNHFRYYFLYLECHSCFLCLSDDLVVIIFAHSFQCLHRWFTSMAGRKSSLKDLISKLWKVGVTIVKTTEFVQGRTSRWGLAWSFLTPVQKPSISMPNKTNMSFTLEV